MKHILLLGAGRSAIYLIDYLADYVAVRGWQLTIADLKTDHLAAKVSGRTGILLSNLNIHQEEQLHERIQPADLVISLLPVAFHRRVAEFCLAQQKHFLSASYVSPEIQELHGPAQRAGLLFLMEMGLDPGLDHLSALATIATIRAKGGKLVSFKSYTGGLLAPASDDNPWHYKIAWNPRNIVLAGQGTTSYLVDHQPKYVPYHQLFRYTETLHIPGMGAFEGYPNRDSLRYRQIYDLPSIPTILRGTLRRPGFCAAWHHLVQLGITDDSYIIPQSARLTYRQWFESYLPPASRPIETIESRLERYLAIPENSPDWEPLRYLELWSEEIIGLANATPAQILEHRLVQKLKLRPDDKDLVVMQHLFEYTLGAERRRLKASLVVTGADAVYTAMAKTVGLPVALAAKLILENKLNQTGVQIPNTPEIYEPILAELKTYGIHFTEEEEVL